jgi:hypothetical protein
LDTHAGALSNPVRERDSTVRWKRRDGIEKKNYDRPCSSAISHGIIAILINQFSFLVSQVRKEPSYFFRSVQWTRVYMREFAAPPMNKNDPFHS